MAKTRYGKRAYSSPIAQVEMFREGQVILDAHDNDHRERVTGHSDCHNRTGCWPVLGHWLRVAAREPAPT